MQTYDIENIEKNQSVLRALESTHHIVKLVQPDFSLRRIVCKNLSLPQIQFKKMTELVTVFIPISYGECSILSKNIHIWLVAFICKNLPLFSNTFDSDFSGNTSATILYFCSHVYCMLHVVFFCHSCVRRKYYYLVSHTYMQQLKIRDSWFMVYAGQNTMR